MGTEISERCLPLFIIEELKQSMFPSESEFLPEKHIGFITANHLSRCFSVFIKQLFNKPQTAMLNFTKNNNVISTKKCKMVGKLPSVMQ